MYSEISGAAEASLAASSLQRGSEMHPAQNLLREMHDAALHLVQGEDTPERERAIFEDIVANGTRMTFDPDVRDSMEIGIDILRWQLLGGDELPAGLFYIQNKDFSNDSVGSSVGMSNQVYDALKETVSFLRPWGLRPFFNGRRSNASDIFRLFPERKARLQTATEAAVRATSAYTLLYGLCEEQEPQPAERPLNENEKLLARSNALGTHVLEQLRLQPKTPPNETPRAETPESLSAKMHRITRTASQAGPRINPDLRRAYSAAELTTVPAKIAAPPSPMDRARQLFTGIIHQHLAEMVGAPFEDMQILEVRPYGSKDLEIQYHSEAGIWKGRQTMQLPISRISKAFLEAVIDPENPADALWNGLPLEGDPFGDTIVECFDESGSSSKDLTELLGQMQRMHTSAISTRIRFNLGGLMYVGGDGVQYHAPIGSLDDPFADSSNVSSHLTAWAAVNGTVGPQLDQADVERLKGDHPYFAPTAPVRPPEIYDTTEEQERRYGQYEVGALLHDARPTAHIKLVEFGPTLETDLPLTPSVAPDLSLAFKPEIFDGHAPVVRGYRLIAAARQGAMQHYHYSYVPEKDPHVYDRLFVADEYSSIPQIFEHFGLSYLSQELPPLGELTIRKLAEYVSTHTRYGFMQKHEELQGERQKHSYAPYLRNGVLTGTCSLYGHLAMRTMGTILPNGLAVVVEGFGVPQAGEDPRITHASSHAMAAFKEGEDDQTDWHYIDFTPARSTASTMAAAATAAATAEAQPNITPPARPETPAIFRKAWSALRIAVQSVIFAPPSLPAPPQNAPIPPSSRIPLQRVMQEAALQTARSEVPALPELRRNLESIIASFIGHKDPASITDAIVALSPDDPARRTMEATLHYLRGSKEPGEAQKLLGYLDKVVQEADANLRFSLFGRQCTDKELAILQGYGHQLFASLR